MPFRAQQIIMALLNVRTNHFYVGKCLFNEILHFLSAELVMSTPTARRFGYVAGGLSLPPMSEPNGTEIDTSYPLRP